jgi:hypothetical protein
MDSVKQIKAVAQTYLQEQQLKEQAEYIAVLENTIIAIAKEIGMEPQQLINEINVGGAIKSGFQQGGIMGAVKGGVRAIGHNVKQRGIAGALGGMGDPGEVQDRVALPQIQKGRAMQERGGNYFAQGMALGNTNRKEYGAELAQRGARVEAGGFRANDRFNKIERNAEMNRNAKRQARWEKSEPA